MEAETKQLSKINIQIKDGRVLINGEKYEDCTDAEKLYFREMLIAMQIEIKEEESKTKNQ